MQPPTASKSLHWFLEQPTRSKYPPSLSLGEDLRLCSAERLKMRMVQLFRLEFVHFKNFLFVYAVELAYFQLRMGPVRSCFDFMVHAECIHIYESSFMVLTIIII